jgi:hypothetical protein
VSDQAVPFHCAVIAELGKLFSLLAQEPTATHALAPVQAGRTCAYPLESLS